MTKRLFIAIPLPREIKDVFLSFKKLNDPQFDEDKRFTNVRWVDEANQHITALFMGAVEDEKVEAISQSINELLEGRQDFTLDFEHFTLIQNSKRNSMVWARLMREDAFSELHNDLHEEMQKFVKLPKSHKDIIPHVTLARFRTNGFVKDFKLKIPTLEESFVEVNRLELWESRLNKQGAKYSSLEKFSFKTL